jgi:hypothetical protein
MTTQRNEAIGQMEEQKHKVVLLQEHMTDLKIKLSRYQQEKMQAERQLQHLMMQQHPRGGATNGGSNTNMTNTNWITPTNGTSTHMMTTTTDTEYYQRKYHESNQKVQSYQAIMIEKNRQIEELRYQVERNMNQQQYNTHLQQQQQQQQKQQRSSPHTTSSPPPPIIMMDSILSSKRQRM